MRRLFLIITVLGLAYFGYERRLRVHEAPRPAVSADHGALAQAISRQQSDVAVQGDGFVTRLLPDDTSGARHQRFIVQLASGSTLLIAHNIDLANRVEPLKVGDRIEFKGEYVWNSQGGIIHWTHRDPAGRHPPGWLKRNGITYQ
jgi:hypothetical protein